MVEVGLMVVLFFDMCFFIVFGGEFMGWCGECKFEDF